MLVTLEPGAMIGREWWTQDDHETYDFIERHWVPAHKGRTSYPLWFYGRDLVRSVKNPRLRRAIDRISNEHLMVSFTYHIGSGDTLVFWYRGTDQFGVLRPIPKPAQHA